LLEVENLSVNYDEARAVTDCNLLVRKGELIALIGANGAGKSTTLKAISRLLSFTGDIRFLERSLKALSPHEVVEVGLIHIPEGRRLFPSMTVLNNLLVGGYSKRARGVRNETLKEIFSLLPTLYERREQLARTLSGGEQQMLAIARGLMANPILLMLDEPSLGLAPIMVNQIFDMVQELKKRGTTLLLVEQNVTKSLELADRVYVMENSRIVLEGLPQTLITNPHVKEAYLGL
jgi:branched-chain amino acid transport system ATP-binding protein